MGLFGAYQERVVGVILLSLAVPLYIYYTFWVIITPFIDKGHPIQSYFPGRFYAVSVPIVFGIVLFTIVLTFISLVMIKAKRKKIYEKTI